MSETMKYCFGEEKKRYQTKGIDERMPMEYGVTMWMLIDELIREKGNADYLQVFEFSVEEENGEKIQKMEHRQEQPEYQEVYRWKLSGAGVTGTVFVIDDDEQCVMLWSSEY